MKNYIGLSLLAIALIIQACGHKNDPLKEVDVSGVEMKPVSIKRYEQDIFSVNREKLVTELRALKRKYPFFLAGNLEDTLNIIQIKEYLNDSLLNELYDDVSQQYKDVSELESTLTSAFKHIKYYYPAFEPPKVYTYVSGLDYKHPVIYADSVMLIALDNYLGSDYKTYRKLNLPKYRIRRMRKDFIPTGCIKEIAFTYLPENNDKTLLDHMIKAGKILYFTDAMLPKMPDSLKMEYTPQQMEWIGNNEGNIWAYLIEKELLYTRNSQSINKLMVDGPFTSTFSQKSPARIGEWVGWQIVKKYMRGNDKATLSEMMQNDNAQAILKRSNYKPEK
ncbi:MAG: hypothetical protein K9I94_01285 [Bacteroidales bacterium]|nr:hypothetical protein [Bacteroidales bacterium]